MKTLDEQTNAIGMILSGVIPDDNLQLHMDAIATTAAMALRSFEPNVPGGDSKPEVWSNWEDFSARMTDFEKKTANMARVAREEGPENAGELAIEALDCKSCHKLYNSKRSDDE
jgi:cytochrome c556